MDILELLALLRRHTLAISATVITAVIAAGVVWYLTPVSATTTTLYSVSISQTETTNAYDLTKVADDFAQTVTGWMKSPTFAAEVSAAADAPVGVRGETQAKQNFLVTLTFPTTAEVERIASAGHEVLMQRITAYNEQSRYTFAVTEQGQSVGDTAKNPALILLAAALGALTLAGSWIIAAAYAGGRITSISEAERLLGVTAAVTFASPTSADTAFLAATAKNKKHLALVGADCDVSPLAATLDGKAEILTLPADASKLANHDLIVVVRLDTTRVATLRMLAGLRPEHLTLAIWG